MNHALRIPVPTHDKLISILQIEDFLHEMGITFDTGYDVHNKTRNWYIDNDSEGITVVELNE